MTGLGHATGRPMTVLGSVADRSMLGTAADRSMSVLGYLADRSMLGGRWRG